MGCPWLRLTTSQTRHDAIADSEAQSPALGWSVEDEEISEGVVGKYSHACPHCGGTDFQFDDERASFIKVCTNPDCSGKVLADPFEA